MVTTGAIVLIVLSSRRFDEARTLRPKATAGGHG